MNILTDEDLSLSNGDSRRCEHCGKVSSVDDWHSCPQGAAASRAEAEAFTKHYFGDGSMVTREFIVTITCPNTETAFQDALSNMEASFEDGEGHDDILKIHWKVEPL